MNNNIDTDSLVDESYDSCEGVSYTGFSGDALPFDEVPQPITSISELTEQVEKRVFAKSSAAWDDRKSAILKVLERLDLSTTDVNKYTFWDLTKPYTRNLAFSNKDFTILLLCWNPGRESKIHNHPCDGCFVKTLRGCIRETRYEIDNIANTLTETGKKFFTEGQVSYMADDLGLHKISNSNKETGAVSLHLYSPPFASCKCWNGSSTPLNDFEMAKVGFFSVFGLRTPQLEGKPGLHARMLDELLLRSSTNRKLLDCPRATEDCKKTAPVSLL